MIYIQLESDFDVEALEITVRIKGNSSIFDCLSGFAAFL